MHTLKAQAGFRGQDLSFLKAAFKGHCQSHVAQLYSYRPRPQCHHPIPSAACALIILFSQTTRTDVAGRKSQQPVTEFTGKSLHRGQTNAEAGSGTISINYVMVWRQGPPSDEATGPEDENDGRLVTGINDKTMSCPGFPAEC